MRYKIGDTVTVKVLQDDMVFNKDMLVYSNREAKITKKYGNFYRIDIDCGINCWTDNMLK